MCAVFKYQLWNEIMLPQACNYYIIYYCFILLYLLWTPNLYIIAIIKKNSGDGDITEICVLKWYLNEL
jgi:hypothetical protein